MTDRHSIFAHFTLEDQFIGFCGSSGESHDTTRSRGCVDVGVAIMDKLFGFAERVMSPLLRIASFIFPSEQDEALEQPPRDKQAQKVGSVPG